MDTLRKACRSVLEKVMEHRDADSGVWTGELSSSALGTALAITALEAGEATDRTLAEAGANWLCLHANADGGWGDTPESVSNLSTTLIAQAALRQMTVGAGTSGNRGCCWDAVTRRGEAWILVRTGSMEAEALTRSVQKIYGADRTFAVPILAYLALCGRDAAAWRSVPPLPFLLALLPQRVYRVLRLQVVSYALPALIAVGLCRHVCTAKSRGGFAWGHLFAGPLLRRLSALQPEHGGFLDAIPLTAFVTLALRHAGYGEHPVAVKGMSFLRGAARRDGSWAIDSNLRTWVTSLAVRATASELGVRREALGIGDGERERVADWLMRTQVRVRHPYTGATPGGWAWTDLPGGVPDADDTSGALIALRRLKDAGCRCELSEAVRSGVNWLLALQNADGGMPTFCRGWGRLPFDRSCPDISAHALSALAVWPEENGTKSSRAARRVAIGRLIRYLERAQEPDGSWMPLWFGHQDRADGKNPVIGTARVVDALRVHAARTGAGSDGLKQVQTMLARGEAWLLAQQRTDGGWSAGERSTVEETALVVIALTGERGAFEGALRRGCGWLVENWESGLSKPSPVGLYFSLLWYHERLYPLIWTLEALGKNINAFALEAGDSMRYCNGVS